MRLAIRVFAVVLLCCPAASAKPLAVRPASAFVDSIGVNTHFGNATYAENAYANRQIGAKLAALGVRHIRDHTWNDAGLRIVDDLHRRHGIRATLVLGETTRTPADIVKLLKAHPADEAVEGLNEPDFTLRKYKSLADDREKGDYAATRAFQDELYAAVKGDPKTKAIPVLSPAMGRSNRSPSPRLSPQTAAGRARTRHRLATLTGSTHRRRFAADFFAPLARLALLRFALPARRAPPPPARPPVFTPRSAVIAR